MKKQYLVASFIVSSLFVPVLASAATADEIRAQIQSLLSQITALQTQLSNLTSNTSTTISTPSNSCPNLYRTLSRGSRGSDVISLQQFLIAQGLLNSDSATGFFGPATEGAVQRWQAQNSIISYGDAASTGYGVIGARTRAAFAARCGTFTPPTNTSSGCVSDSKIHEVGASLTCINNEQQGQKCAYWANFVCSKGGTWTLADRDSMTGQKVTLSCEEKYASPKPVCAKTIIGASENYSGGDTNIYGYETFYSSCALKMSRGTFLHDGPCLPEDKVTKPPVVQSCPIYNACPSGYTANTSTDANGCTTSQCVPPATAQPSIQVVSPNGGEEFASGSTITVRWSTSGLPSDIANRHPRLSFSLSDFDSQGNYGTYTGVHKQSNGVMFGDAITSVSAILGGSATVPVTLHHASPNKYARGFLRVDLSYDRQLGAQQAASVILATSPVNPHVEIGGTTKTEITISFPTASTGNACFDDYQSWDLGGTWFADGERRSSTCLVGGPGSGTVDWSCQRPNICTNGQWKSGGVDGPG